MLRQLQPWHENLSKRQVKSPKVYFRDTGLLHSFLGVYDFHAIIGHPQAGASWEGFALEQILRIVQPAEAYFWATYSGAELDLFFIANGLRLRRRVQVRRGAAAYQVHDGSHRVPETRQASHRLPWRQDLAGE